MPKGSAAAITGGNTVRPRFTADITGSYTAKLIVQAGNFRSNPSTLVITAASGNLAPIANAGLDRTVPPGTNVTLDGSGSTDPNGTVVTYSWSITARPSGSTAQLSNTTSANPSFTADKVGAYKVLLKVSDGTLASAPANVVITAATGNIPPIADAGADRTATTGISFSLDGSTSLDPNGDPISAYSWRFQSRPVGSSATLNGANTVSTVFTPDSEGFYVLTLLVSDGQVASSLDTVVITASAPIGGSGTVQTSGGTVTTNLANVTVPPNAALRPVQISVTPILPPPGLPTGLASVGLATDITVTNSDLINVPFRIILKYVDGNGLNEENMAAVHFNTTTNSYEPVTIWAHDKDQNTLTIESRTFSPFVIVTYDSSLVPVSSNTGFQPERNGWNIKNFGGDFSSDGMCLGMSEYAAWFFGHRSGQLFGKYPSVGIPTGTPSIAQLVATRAMLAQNQSRAYRELSRQVFLPDADEARTMRMYLSVFKQPLVFLLSTSTNAAESDHVGVRYGYDSTGFLFYDPDFPGLAKRVDFGSGTWGTYVGDGGTVYRGFAFLAQPSLGRTEDFAVLTTQAEGGFTSSTLMFVTSPSQNQQITTNTTPLVGGLSGSFNPFMTLVTYLRGVRQSVPVTASGTFSTNIQVASGVNTLLLLAGVDLDNQSDWYPNAATLIRTFQGCPAL